ncbi:MAG: DUF815 domain-containing protein, partial [Nevskiales bacterium]
MKEDRPRGPRRPSFGGDRPRRSFGDRPARNSDGERKPFRAREGGGFSGDRKPYRKRDDGAPSSGERSGERSGPRDFQRPRRDFDRPKASNPGWRRYNRDRDTADERPPVRKPFAGAGTALRPETYRPDEARPVLKRPSAELVEALAYRWRGGALKPIAFPHELELDDLLCVDSQKAALVQNTRQFARGLPANHALLWGSRGTGKSSLVKALLKAFGTEGLRLVEVPSHDLTALPEIVAPLRGRKERFVLYVDDFSVGANDPALMALKTALDGGLEAPPENVLIYATSNRRHLLPELQSENQQAQAVDGEIHHSEAVEEKIALSERFGLWLSFYPFNQDQYLEIVRH